MTYYSTKICILGSSNVGKSSLMHRIVEDKFNERAEPTIGASFNTYIYFDNFVNQKLEIWDTAGQERYSSLAPLYYRNSHVAILVASTDLFDTSLDKVIYYIEKLKSDEPKIKFLFVLNKSDEITVDEADIMIAKFHLEIKSHTTDDVIIKTSAKTGIGCDEIIDHIKLLINKKEIIPTCPETIINLIKKKEDKKCC